MQVIEFPAFYVLFPKNGLQHGPFGALQARRLNRRGLAMPQAFRSHVEKVREEVAKSF